MSPQAHTARAPNSTPLWEFDKEETNHEYDEECLACWVAYHSDGGARARSRATITEAQYPRYHG